MTQTPSSFVFHESELQIAVRYFASALPALILGYSALIDPLINYEMFSSTHIYGVQISGAVKSTIATKIIIPLLFLVALIFSLIAPLKYPRALNLVTLSLVAYFGLALVSSMWSRSPSHTFTFALYQIILCSSLFLAIGVSANPAKIMQNLFWLFAIVVFINVIFVLAFSPNIDGNRGIYTYKNSLGMAAGSAFIIAIYRISSTQGFMRFVALVTCAAAMFLLVVSESKTSLGMAFIAPAIAICWVSVSRVLQVSVMVSAFFTLVAITAAYVVLSQVFWFEFTDLIILVFGEDTFTGRVDVWNFMFSHIMDSPLYGQGYRGFWGIGADSPKLHSEIIFARIVGNGHNGYLDSLLDLGVIGLSIKIVFLISIILACNRFLPRFGNGQMFTLAILLFVIGRNSMESVIFWSTFFDNLLLILVGFLSCLSWNRHGSHEPLLMHSMKQNLTQ